MGYSSSTPSISESRVGKRLVVARGSDALSLQEVADILNEPERIATLNKAAHYHATGSRGDTHGHVNYKIILPLKAVDGSEGNAYAMVLTGPDTPSARYRQIGSEHDLFILYKEEVNLFSDFGYSKDERFIGAHVNSQIGGTSLLEIDIDGMYHEDSANYTPECVIRSKADHTARPRM